jgi:hypothetical protein
MVQTCLFVRNYLQLGKYYCIITKACENCQHYFQELHKVTKILKNECCNPNIGFTAKSEVQKPMRAKICLGVKHNFTNEREYKGWSPMTLKCTPTLRVALMRDLQMFKTLVGKKENTKWGPRDTIRKVLKCRCLKCPLIVHLDLICMSYDQKKRQESKLGIWLPTTNPLKVGAKWG